MGIPPRMRRFIILIGKYISDQDNSTDIPYWLLKHTWIFLNFCLSHFLGAHHRQQQQRVDQQQHVEPQQPVELLLDEQQLQPALLPHLATQQHPLHHPAIKPPHHPVLFKQQQQQQPQRDPAIKPPCHPVRQLPSQSSRLPSIAKVNIIFQNINHQCPAPFLLQQSEIGNGAFMNGSKLRKPDILSSLLIKKNSFSHSL